MNKSTIINLVLAAKLPCYNYPHAFVFEMDGVVHECFEDNGRLFEQPWENLTLKEYHEDYERMINEELTLRNIFGDDAESVAVMCMNIYYFEQSCVKRNLNQLNYIAEKHGAHIEWCGLDAAARQRDKFIITYDYSRYLITIDALRHDGVNARLQSI